MSTKAQILLGTLPESEHRRYLANASSRASRRSSFSSDITSIHQQQHAPPLPQQKQQRQPQYQPPHHQSSSPSLHPPSATSTPEQIPYPTFSVSPQPYPVKVDQAHVRRLSNGTLRSFAPPVIPTYIPARHGTSPFLQQTSTGMMKITVSATHTPVAQSQLAVPLYTDAEPLVREIEQKRGIRKAFSKFSIRQARSQQGKVSNLREGWTAVLPDLKEGQIESPQASPAESHGEVSRTSKSGTATPKTSNATSENHGSVSTTGPNSPQRAAAPSVRTKNRREWFDDIDKSDEDTENKDARSHRMRSSQSTYSKKSSKAASVLGLDVSALPPNAVNTSFRHARRLSDTLSRSSIIYEQTIVSLSDSEEEAKAAKQSSGKTPTLSDSEEDPPKPIKRNPRKDSGYRSSKNTDEGDIGGEKQGVPAKPTDKGPDRMEATLSLFPTVPSRRDTHNTSQSRPPSSHGKNSTSHHRTQKPPPPLAVVTGKSDNTDDSSYESLPSLAGSVSTGRTSVFSSKSATPKTSAGLKNEFDRPVVDEDEQIIVTPIDIDPARMSIIQDIRRGNGTNRIIAAISPEEAILISKIRRHRQNASNFSNASTIGDKSVGSAKSSRHSRSASHPKTRSSSQSHIRSPSRQAPPVPAAAKLRSAPATSRTSMLQPLQLSASSNFGTPTTNQPDELSSEVTHHELPASIPAADPMSTTESETTADSPTPSNSTVVEASPRSSPEREPTPTADNSTSVLGPTSTTTTSSTTSAWVKPPAFATAPLPPLRTSSLVQHTHPALRPANGSAPPRIPTPRFFRPISPPTENKRWTTVSRPVSPAPRVAPPPPPPPTQPVPPVPIINETPKQMRHGRIPIKSSSVSFSHFRAPPSQKPGSLSLSPSQVQGHPMSALTPSGISPKSFAVTQFQVTPPVVEPATPTPSPASGKATAPSSTNPTPPLPSAPATTPEIPEVPEIPELPESSKTPVDSESPEKEENDDEIPQPPPLKTHARSRSQTVIPAQTVVEVDVNATETEKDNEIESSTQMASLAGTMYSPDVAKDVLDVLRELGG